MNRFLIFFVFLVISCSSAFFEESQEINPESWKYEEGAEFSFSIEDTSVYYNLELDLNHSTSFRYQNIYIQTETTFPSGESASDVLSLQLTDDYADWIGDCSGETCVAPYVLQESARFKEAGDYTIRIKQHSRENKLSGVNGLTLRLVKRR